MFALVAVDELIDTTVSLVLIQSRSCAINQTMPALCPRESEAGSEAPGITRLPHLLSVEIGFISKKSTRSFSAISVIFVFSTP